MCIYIVSRCKIYIQMPTLETIKDYQLGGGCLSYWDQVPCLVWGVAQDFEKIDDSCNEGSPTSSNDTLDNQSPYIHESIVETQRNVFQERHYRDYMTHLCPEVNP